MDDLKVILYVVIAIAWMIYNNYKKVGDASKKRDPSQPIPEVIEENWPKETPYEPPQSTKRQYVETISDQVNENRVPKRDKLKRQPLKKAGILPRKRKEPLFLSTHEGGSTQPSLIVQFDDNDSEDELEVNWVHKIRNADFKQGIIMTEILQRPYS